MPVHPLAGKPAPPEALIDIARLEREFLSRRPDPANPRERVKFGTSGHRGTPLDRLGGRRSWTRVGVHGWMWRKSLEKSGNAYAVTPVRENLDAGVIEPGSLTPEDYHWELQGGGDPALDMKTINWGDDIGSAIRFADLQAFLVVCLPALRDVEQDLRSFRNSPLARLIAAMEIGSIEQEQLLDALRQANETIKGAPTTATIGSAVDTSFKNVTGPAFSMNVGLGLAQPSFQSIVRSMRILLSNTAMAEFDPSCNGLGLNNILYVSILIDRKTNATAGAGMIAGAVEGSGETAGDRLARLVRTLAPETARLNLPADDTKAAEVLRGLLKGVIE